jgi:hypothetical protein
MGTSIAVYGAHEAHTAVLPWIDGFSVDVPVHGCFRRLLHEGVDFWRHVPSWGACCLGGFSYSFMASLLDDYMTEW